MKEMDNPICRYCGSKDTKKSGRHVGVRKIVPNSYSDKFYKKHKNLSKFYIRQKYRCKTCYRFFTIEPKYMRFGIEMVEDAIRHSFNHTFRETSTYIKKKYKIYISFNTIVKWTNDYLETGKIFGMKIESRGNTALVENIFKKLKDIENRLLKIEAR